MQTAICLLLVVFFLLMNAFFVIAEFALVRVRKSQIDMAVAEKRRGAEAARDVTTHINAYLSACQLGITLASLAIGWLGEPAVPAVLEAPLLAWGFPEATVYPICVAVGFFIVTTLHVVVGELIPKSFAIFATEKAQALGAKVVTASDSNGYVYDPNGIDLAYVKDLKEVRRGRIKEYAETHEGVTYVADCTKVWTVPCDIALPCATQNEINKESAEALVKGGCTVVCEGANMPSTPEAIEVYLSNGILYGPAKASNAGGVATSGLEMSQNSERLSWSFEEVDAKLKGIMEGIFHASYDASVAAGSEGNLMVGANCAGFLKVATAMMAQGITY